MCYGFLVHKEVCIIPFVYCSLKEHFIAQQKSEIKTIVVKTRQLQLEGNCFLHHTQKKNTALNLTYFIVIYNCETDSRIKINKI